MDDNSVTIRLNLDTSGFNAGLASARGALRGIGVSGGGGGRTSNPLAGIERVEYASLKATEKQGSSLSRLLGINDKQAAQLVAIMKGNFSAANTLGVMETVLGASLGALGAIAAVAAVIVVGISALQVILKPIMKILSAIGKILGAALMPIAMVVVTLLQPLIYLLLPFVRLMNLIFRPLRIALAQWMKQNAKTLATASPLEMFAALGGVIGKFIPGFSVLETLGEFFSGKISLEDLFPELTKDAILTALFPFILSWEILNFIFPSLTVDNLINAIFSAALTVSDIISAVFVALTSIDIINAVFTALLPLDIIRAVFTKIANSDIVSALFTMILEASILAALFTLVGPAAILAAVFSPVTGFDIMSWIFGPPKEGGVTTSTATEALSYVIASIPKVLKTGWDEITSGKTLNDIIGGTKGLSELALLMTTGRVGDAIITPSGKVIQTSPSDYLMATSNPGGMGGVTNYFEFNVEGNIDDKTARYITQIVQREIATQWRAIAR